jgi:hypothetical protein
MRHGLVQHKKPRHSEMRQPDALCFNQQAHHQESSGSGLAMLAMLKMGNAALQRLRWATNGCIRHLSITTKISGENMRVMEKTLKPKGAKGDDRARESISALEQQMGGQQMGVRGDDTTGIVTFARGWSCPRQQR